MSAGAPAWELELRGGAYDGVSMFADRHEPLLVAWVCGPLCEGHASFDAEHPAIVISSAVAYRRASVDTEQRLAVYEVGDSEPAVDEHADERELVPAGA